MSRKKIQSMLLPNVTFYKALDMRRRGGIERCTLSADTYHLHILSSDRTREYVVTVSHGLISCSCPARGLCPHILATVFYPALETIAQIRFAQDLQWLELVVDKYAPAVRELPEGLRSLVRRELHHRDEQIRRSGGNVYAEKAA